MQQTPSIRPCRAVSSGLLGSGLSERMRSAVYLSSSASLSQSPWGNSLLAERHQILVNSHPCVPDVYPYPLHVPLYRQSCILCADSSVAASNSLFRCRNSGTFAPHHFAGIISLVIVQTSDFTLPLVLILKKDITFTCWTPQCP